jgi:hypothetical protein
MELESLDHAKSPRRRYGQLSTTMAAANRYMASCKYFVRRGPTAEHRHFFVMVNPRCWLTQSLGITHSRRTRPSKWTIISRQAKASYSQAQASGPLVNQPLRERQ